MAGARQFAGNSVDGPTRRRSARQSRDQSAKSGRSLVPRHPRETDGLQPRIEIGPRQRRNDAEQLTVSIFAYRGEQERIELAPYARRHRGVGHFVNRFCLTPTSNGAGPKFSF